MGKANSVGIADFGGCDGGILLGTQSLRERSAAG